MLAKTVGVSQLIYAASMLTVPEVVIQKTQAELFAFLWKNKKDKIKRQAPVVRRVDNAIQRINRYPVDSAVSFVDTYPLDSDLSGG